MSLITVITIKIILVLCLHKLLVSWGWLKYLDCMSAAPWKARAWGSMEQRNLRRTFKRG